MTTSKTILALALAVALGACSKDGGGAGDPKSQCEQMYTRRAKHLNIDKSDATRALFMDACVQQPAEYLRCETVDIVATRDAACAATIRAHAEEQDLLNTILFTGKAPG